MCYAAFVFNLEQDMDNESHIERITLRFLELQQQRGQKSPKGDHILFMHLCAAQDAHPMNLEMLLIAADDILLEEVSGIAEYFNPQTGGYSGAFRPRYAAQCCGQCNHTGH